jgi:hypothetical protein
MGKIKPRGRPRKTVKHTGRNVAIVVLLLLLTGFGIYGALIATGVVDNPLDEDNGYAGSGISEEDWFDGELCWTVYVHPDDSTVTVELPNDGFVIEEHIHYDDFNSSNITEFGGFVAEGLNLENPEDIDSPADSARIFVVLYAELNDSIYDSSRLYELVLLMLDLTDIWELHSFDGETWTVDEHGEQEIHCHKGIHDTEDMIGMYAYSAYYCGESDRTYLIFYGVAKNTSINTWSDIAFKAECQYIFESFTCHD